MSSETAATVGPVILSHPIPQRQLREEGVVVSFRHRERTTGNTWWRESRHGPKEGDVTIDKIDAAESPFDLVPYVEQSGFGTVEDWQTAIAELHGTEATEGHLYRIEEGHE